MAIKFKSDGRLSYLFHFTRGENIYSRAGIKRLMYASRAGAVGKRLDARLDARLASRLDL